MNLCVFSGEYNANSKDEIEAPVSSLVNNVYEMFYEGSEWKNETGPYLGLSDEADAAWDDVDESEQIHLWTSLWYRVPLLMT